MGYICPDCGEGLPEDETCPCTMTDDDDDHGDYEGIIRGPLTAEICSIRSPVRRFLNERFTVGLRDVQRSYRENDPSQVVPSVPPSGANPGTIGTAADWLLGFLLHPCPVPDLAMAGVALCRSAGIDITPALIQIADSLGVHLPQAPGTERKFTGPVPGNTAEPDYLARCCWALALLTEVYRGGAFVLTGGPLGQFRRGKATADDLLALCPPAGLDQLAKFRRVFETVLIPQLARRHGLWVLGPVFTGSALIHADADLIAAGLLLELKTSSKKLSLPVTDLFQLIGYALLDFDDEFRIAELGIFSARYAYLVTWELGAVLDELAGHPVNISRARDDFRHLLLRGRARVARSHIEGGRQWTG